VFRNVVLHTYLPMKMEETECSESSFFTPTCLWRWNRQCSETLAYKIYNSLHLPAYVGGTDSMFRNVCV